MGNMIQEILEQLVGSGGLGDLSDPESWPTNVSGVQTTEELVQKVSDANNQLVLPPPNDRGDDRGGNNDHPGEQQGTGPMGSNPPPFQAPGTGGPRLPTTLTDDRMQQFKDYLAYLNAHTPEERERLKQQFLDSLPKQPNPYAKLDPTTFVPPAQQIFGTSPVMPPGVGVRKSQNPLDATRDQILQPFADAFKPRNPITETIQDFKPRNPITETIQEIQKALTPPANAKPVYTPTDAGGTWTWETPNKFGNYPSDIANPPKQQYPIDYSQWDSTKVTTSPPPLDYSNWDDKRITPPASTPPPLQAPATTPPPIDYSNWDDKRITPPPSPMVPPPAANTVAVPDTSDLTAGKVFIPGEGWVKQTGVGDWLEETIKTAKTLESMTPAEEAKVRSLSGPDQLLFKQMVMDKLNGKTLNAPEVTAGNGASGGMDLEGLARAVVSGKMGEEAAFEEAKKLGFTGDQKAFLVYKDSIAHRGNASRGGGGGGGGGYGGGTSTYQAPNPGASNFDWSTMNMDTAYEQMLDRVMQAAGYAKYGPKRYGGMRNPITDLLLNTTVSDPVINAYLRNLFLQQGLWKDTSTGV